MDDDINSFPPGLVDALQAFRLSSPGKQVEQVSDFDESAMNRRLYEMVIAEVSAFSESSNPQIMPSIQQHLTDLITDVLRLLRGGQLCELAFVQDFARNSAEQYFPLEPILCAYRISIRSLRQSLFDQWRKQGELNQTGPCNAATDFLLEYFHLASTVTAENYVDQSRLLADVASDQRSELLSILLSGYDESDRRVSRILRDAGYLDRRTAFCVVVAQSIDPAEMHNPARARRMADYIDRLLQKIPGKRLVDIHRNKVVIVFSHLRRLSGWSTPQASLAQRVAQELLKIGTAAHTGVSNDVFSTSQVPLAYRQAELAFGMSDVGSRVIKFADIPLQQLLQHFAGEAFLKVLPAWAQLLYETDDRSRGELSRTLHAFADENMNVLKTAKRLSLHPNTVYARFNRIIAITGRDPREFHPLTELLTVATSRVYFSGQ